MVKEPDRAPPERKDDKSFDYKENINPDSLQVVPKAMLEPSLGKAQPGDRFQFERLGYFCVDPDSTPGRQVFNRSVTLKDAWQKIQGRQGGRTP